MRVVFMVVAFFVTGCEPPVSDEASQQQGLKYEPAPAAVSACVPACADLNGKCTADCTGIMCDIGFADCNNDLKDGCETSLNQPSTCGACDNDCTECNDQAVCVSGKCGGKSMPNGAACRPSLMCQGENRGGVCMAGQCMCDDAVDMAGLPKPFNPAPDMAHASDLPGDCSFTGGGTATASMLLLVGALLLLNRRRRAR